MKNKSMRVVALAGLLAVSVSLSALAGIYTANYTDSGPIPRDGSVLPFEHTISDIIDPTISKVEIILTFSDSTHLAGNGSGIQGHLNLGTSDTSPSVNFYPTATSSSGSQRIYDVSFSGTPSSGTGFNGLNPNGTWGLVLWDNNSGGLVDNGLVGWSLAITPVPEPVNVALGIFGGVIGLVLVGRSRPVRNCVQRWRAAFVVWVNAV
jgi:hypothetical protein